jgi:hypothetical protein
VSPGELGFGTTGRWLTGREVDLSADRCEALPHLQTDVPFAERDRGTVLCHAMHVDKSDITA